MQQPMDSYVCGINTNSEGILIHIYCSRYKLVPCEYLVHLVNAKSKSDKTRELTSNLYQKRKNAQAVA